MFLADYSLSIKIFSANNPTSLKTEIQSFYFPTKPDQGFLFALALNSKTILHATKRNPKEYEVFNVKDFEKTIIHISSDDVREVFFNSYHLLNSDFPECKRTLTLLKEMEPLCF